MSASHTLLFLSPMAVVVGAIIASFIWLPPNSAAGDVVLVVLGAFGVAIPIIDRFVLRVPRQLTMQPESVTLRFVARAVSIPWSALAPDFSRVHDLDSLRVRYSDPSSRIPRRYQFADLTSGQGRALLSHPRASRWSSTAEVLREWSSRSG
jgi:hypothetical protein